MNFDILIFIIVLQFVLIFCNNSLCPSVTKCCFSVLEEQITVECSCLENTQLKKIFKRDLIFMSISQLKISFCSATTISTIGIRNIYFTYPLKNNADSSLPCNKSLEELQLLKTGQPKGILNEIPYKIGLVKFVLKNKKIRKISKKCLC